MGVTRSCADVFSGCRCRRRGTEQAQQAHQTASPGQQSDPRRACAYRVLLGALGKRLRRHGWTSRRGGNRWIQVVEACLLRRTLYRFSCLFPPGILLVPDCRVPQRRYTGAGQELKPDREHSVVRQHGNGGPVTRLIALRCIDWRPVCAREVRQGRWCVGSIGLRTDRIHGHRNVMEVVR